jgi:hypothetical protein
MLTGARSALVPTNVNPLSVTTAIDAIVILANDLEFMLDSFKQAFMATATIPVPNGRRRIRSRTFYEWNDRYTGL